MEIRRGFLLKHSHSSLFCIGDKNDESKTPRHDFQAHRFGKHRNAGGARRETPRPRVLRNPGDRIAGHQGAPSHQGAHAGRDAIATRPSKRRKRTLQERFIRMFSNCVLSVTSAGNMIVIKTIAGSAPAAAEAVDSLKWPDILGSIAGRQHDLHRRSGQQERWRYH